MRQARIFLAVLAVALVGAVVLMAGPAPVKAASPPNGGPIDALQAQVAALQSAVAGHLRTPFIHKFQGQLSAGMHTASASLDLPANKHLVIETFSASVQLPSFQKVADVSLEIQFGSDPTCGDGGCPIQAEFHLPVFLQGAIPPGGYDIFNGWQATRLYAESGTHLAVNVSRTSLEGEGNFLVSVSGYLIPRTVPNLSP